MRLTPISYNVLHQFYSSHGCAAVELLNLLGVGIHQEFIEIVMVQHLSVAAGG